MPTNQAEIYMKKTLMDELAALDSGYIIVQEEILRILIEAAPSHIIQAAQRILQGCRPNFKSLDPKSPTVCWDVKVLRKANKISQTRLAKAAQMEQPDISEFERGSNTGFSEDRKKRIVDALKSIIAEVHT